MKNNSFIVLSTALFLAACSDSTASEKKQPPVTPPLKETLVGDFEKESSTPYFFRFGNKGSAKEYDYKPRWVYSHTVVKNPVANVGNPSSQVLKYTSMEARNYGVKFLFSNPVPVDALECIQFNILQPTNVIGKPVWQGGSSARVQELCIKLLSKFNTIIDFRQDDGIIVKTEPFAFTEENEWLTYSCDFNAADYGSQINKFKDGIVGIAILPTYKSEVTLTEETPYICYIDNIVLNPVR